MTKWTECEGGSPEEKDDHPGELIGIEVVDTLELEATQEVDRHYTCRKPCSNNPVCSYSDDLPGDPWNNPSPCPNYPEGTCEPCPEPEE